MLFVLISYFINQIANGQDARVCYEKSYRYLNRNVAKIIDVSLGSNIKMECNYCDEEDDFKAKVWYFRKRGHIKCKHELITNFYYDHDPKKNKIDINPSHTLHIKYFDENNSGVYICSYFDGKEDIFKYILDAIYDVRLVQRSGTKNDWYEFRRNMVDPTNYFIRNKNVSLMFPFEVVFSWRNWGSCKTYGHENERQKIGKCRVRPIRHKIIQMISTTPNLNTKLAAYLLDTHSVSCRSIELNKFYPEIGQIIRNLPEFVIKESCNLTKRSAKTKSYKIEQVFKYNVTEHVVENSHLILRCPEAAVTSQIHWFKDNCLLNSSFRNNMAKSLIEPHIAIDDYNVLYILRATKADEGIYACTVVGRYMQMFNVKVVSKYKFLNKDFIRYSIYLGFILSLTVTCYCAGICIAWQRRGSFADPLNLMKKQHSSDDHKSFINNSQY